MPERSLELALAGLLHDVGKFMWRAGVGQQESWTESAKTEVGYWHALASDSFVQDHVPASLRRGLSGPRFHHHPDRVPTQENEVRRQAHLVRLADWLASGEREDDEDARIPYLRSPFSRIADYDQPWFYPLAALSDEGQNRLFPRRMDDASWKAQSEQDYAALWDRFDRACQSRLDGIDGERPGAYLETLYYLLQEYTWCIPSAAYRTTPDVSLFDHSRMTAALAVCLGEDERTAEWCDQVAEGLHSGGEANQQEVARLVGGDISGVQSFIYTVTSSGAAKSLRGRSFYLQVLTEAVSHYVLRQLGLPITNLIYAGGGNFYLLCPVSQEAQLAEIQADVTARLLSAHDGGLHLALGHTPVRACEFERTHFHEAWQRLQDTLGRIKLQPLVNLPDEVLAGNLGQGMGTGGDTDAVCSVCGREIQPGEPTSSEDSGAMAIRKCGLCDSFERLGTDLANATHMVMARTKPQQREHIHRWWHGLQSFGFAFWTVNASRSANEGHYLRIPNQTERVHLNVLSPGAAHDGDLRAELVATGLPVVESYRPFAQLVPRNQTGQILTFDELAERSARGGLKRWGVLRMDVDNMGGLFKEGFISGQGEERTNSLTLSRVAGLSLALRLFFEGWLPNVGRESKTLANRIYVQYAGGDDLFVVGSWDALPEFALQIRDAFQAFACENPNVTLSGGVALVPERYPLYQAAQDAEDEENRAKQYRRQPCPTGRPADKDAFCFLGQTVGWEQFRPVRELAHQLETWCGGDPPAVPKALLQTLQAIHTEYRHGRDQALAEGKWQPSQVYFGPWMWHLAYQLARRIRDRRTPEEVGRALEQMEKEMISDPQRIETVGLSARWAQFLVR